MATEREVPVTRSGAIESATHHGGYMPSEGQLVLVAHLDQHYGGRVMRIDPRHGSFCVWLKHALPNGHHEVWCYPHEYGIRWMRRAEVIKTPPPKTHQYFDHLPDDEDDEYSADARPEA